MPTLNNDTVAKLPLAAAGQYIERDDKLPDFFVVVGKRTKTFTVQVDGKKPDGTRTSRREKVGTFPEMSVTAARERARSLQIELGARKPKAEPDAYTLRRAWGAYRELMVRKVDAGEKSAGARPKNRRPPAVLDPVAVAREGEVALRERLAPLSFDQLRDIVADYGMDPGKLVMKWKDPARVLDRIVEVSLQRASKGDAFKAE